MFREQDADREARGEPRGSISKTPQLERFQVDLQASLAFRLLGASSAATEQETAQANVHAWTENWARISGQSATQAMPT
jgi:hypothetical protein